MKQTFLSIRKAMLMAAAMLFAATAAAETVEITVDQALFKGTTGDYAPFSSYAFGTSTKLTSMLLGETVDNAMFQLDLPTEEKAYCYRKKVSNDYQLGFLQAGGWKITSTFTISSRQEGLQITKVTFSGTPSGQYNITAAFFNLNPTGTVVDQASADEYRLTWTLAGNEPNKLSGENKLSSSVNGTWNIKKITVEYTQSGSGIDVPTLCWGGNHMRGDGDTHYFAGTSNLTITAPENSEVWYMLSDINAAVPKFSTASWTQLSGSALAISNTCQLNLVSRQGTDTSEVMTINMMKVSQSPTPAIDAQDLFRNSQQVTLTAGAFDYEVENMSAVSTLEYRLGEDSDWQEYTVPFAVDDTASVYARQTNSPLDATTVSKNLTLIDATPYQTGRLYFRTAGVTSSTVTTPQPILTTNIPHADRNALIWTDEAVKINLSYDTSVSYPKSKFETRSGDGNVDEVYLRLMKGFIGSIEVTTPNTKLTAVRLICGMRKGDYNQASQINFLATEGNINSYVSDKSYISWSSFAGSASLDINCAAMGADDYVEVLGIEIDYEQTRTPLSISAHPVYGRNSCVVLFDGIPTSDTTVYYTTAEGDDVDLNTSLADPVPNDSTTLTWVQNSDAELKIDCRTLIKAIATHPDYSPSRVRCLLIDEDEATAVGETTEDCRVEYFDLQGRRIAPADTVKGIYLERRNGKTQKIIR